MKLKITTLIILLSTFNTLFSQDFYTSRRDFSDPNNYIHSILQLNNDGNSTLNTYDYTATFPGFNAAESLTFNSDTGEIYSIAENLILKYNINMNTESSFTLPTLTNGDYQGIVIADDRLFVSTRDFTDPNNYIFSLVEVNKTTGATINTYNFTDAALSFSSVESLTYNPTTKEIFGKSDNLILKYNIDTQTESSFNLPTITNGDYESIVIADNRLFVTRRDFSNPSNYIFSLVELNMTNGSTINTYNYTSSLLGFDAIESLTYDADTKEVYGLAGNAVVRYNINTQTESSFNLPVITNGDYGGIVSTKQPSTLSVRDFELGNSNQKIVKAFNLLGQEVPLDTVNEILILLFDDGSRKKVIKTKQAL